ncbi:MAG: decarboxylating 6-phosphogluconate dehydrogenase [Chloroflexi bacterium]|nr:decarboxylating 6-phosphogluconate dehydrogenase [Chloroflexota bacterium]
MKLALLGLGRMGGNMARRLARAGHEVVAFNRTGQVTTRLAEEQKGIIPVYTVEDAVSQLPSPRIVWLMVPEGKPTQDMMEKVAVLLSPGDILVDGGNSNFRDTMGRKPYLDEKQIHFVDVGTSGGVWGLENGYSMMVGGEKEAVDTITPILQSLAPSADKGWGHVGGNGAGHFTKMVHNGIEYGMMEAYAEGFELLKNQKNWELDLHQLSQIWSHSSVVRSWLLELIGYALEEDQELSKIQGWVADSGEGRWTVFEAINNDVPAPVITAALFRRFDSRQDESYAAKLLAATRNQFGGHAMKMVE